MMVGSLPLPAGKRKMVFKGCLWCDNGALSVLAASLTPPPMKVIADGYQLLVDLEDMGPAFQLYVLYWKKGQESRVSYSRVLSNKREPTYLKWKRTHIAQGLSASSSSDCEAGGPAWVGVCHILPHTPMACSYLQGEACLFFPHFLLWEESSPQGPWLLEENRSQGTGGVDVDFVLWTSFGLLRPRYVVKLGCWWSFLRSFL